MWRKLFQTYKTKYLKGIQKSILKITSNFICIYNSILEIRYIFYLKNVLYYKNNAFNSVASCGFILPAKIRLNCFLLRALSKRSISSSVSGIKSGT